MRRGGVSERGAALLTVMMIVAAMSVAALAVTQAVTQATVRSRALDAQAQLAFYGASAEEVAKARLTEIIGPIGSKLVLGMPGLDTPQTIPLEDGVLIVTVRDTTNCFDVNKLTTPGERGGFAADHAQQEAYEALLISLIEDGYASDMIALVSSLTDWMDDNTVPGNGGAEDAYYLGETPSYRTSGQKLNSLDELRAIRGYTPEIFARVRPVLCALPDDAPAQVLNINTLEIHHAPLLRQVFSNALKVEDARDLIASRPTTGWTAVEDLLEDPIVEAIDPTLLRLDRLGLVTSLVEVSTNISYRGSDMTMRFLFEIQPGRPIRTLRRERIG